MRALIVSVFHKEYWTPDDAIYLPLQVGFGPDLNFKRDNTGENISSRNKTYCELTALYWAWKNIRADYIGLDHYRRHFSVKQFGNKKERILLKKDFETIVNKYPADIYLPEKRNYFIETNKSQYIHAHHKEDLEALENVIAEKYPEYLNAYKKVMDDTKGHRFNMFIMKYDVFCRYAEFLFDVLFEVEQNLDISTYNEYDRRVFGFLSERILDVWLYKNNYSYKDLPYVYMDKQNWFIKVYRFLKRKFYHGEKNC